MGFGGKDLRKVTVPKFGFEAPYCPVETGGKGAGHNL